MDTTLVQQDVSTQYILGAAAFIIVTLVSITIWMVKDRIALRQKHETQLAAVQEIANKEHLEQVEMRLGFGSDNMRNLAHVQELLKDQLQKDHLKFTEAMQSVQVAMGKLCESFVTAGVCKEHREVQAREFEEVRKAIADLAVGQHELALKLEGVSVHVQASSDSMKDLTTKLVDALELTANRDRGK